MADSAFQELDYYRGSLYGALCGTAAEHPALGALNFIGRRYRYDFLLDRVDSFAAALAESGIKRGDVVSIMLPNCPQAVIAFYATNKLGAIANMVHPLMSAGELEYSLALVGAKMLVTMDLFYDKATQAIDGWNSNRDGHGCKIVVTKIVDELPIYARAVFKVRAKKEDLPAHPVRAGKGVALYRTFIGRGSLANKQLDAVHDTEIAADRAQDPAAILFSGGTTGTPKGILLSNANINAETAQALSILSFPPTPGDRVLGALPLFHGFGLAIGLHMAISAGLECLLVPRLTVEEYTKVILRGKCNIIVGVPTLLGRIADLPGGDNLDLSFIKEVVSGGDGLPKEMRRRIDERLAAGGSPVRVREGYGATECTAAAAVEPSSESRENSFGCMLPGDRCKIVDPATGEELAPGQEGELLVAGPTVMIGYWNNPEATGAIISADDDGTRWLHTGDIACRDEDGFLFYRGRIKRMIISSGYNIYPDQIEHELGKLPEVASACVIAIPDSYRLHRLKAFVVLKPGFGKTNETRAAIMEGLKDHIARYAWPKEIEFRDELPLTKVGKIAYRELEREEAEKRTQTEDAQTEEVA